MSPPNDLTTIKTSQILTLSWVTESPFHDHGASVIEVYEEGKYSLSI